MQPHDSKENKGNARALSAFPRGHMVVAAALTIGLLSWGLTSTSKPEANTTEAINLKLPIDIAPTQAAFVAPPAASSNHEEASAPQTQAEAVTAPKIEATPPLETTAQGPAPSPLESKSFTVRSGDSLSTLFKRAGLNDRDVYQLTSTCKEAKSLTRIMPGHELVFYMTPDGELEKLSHIPNKLNSTHFEKDDKGFRAVKEVKQPEIRPTYKEAIIASSLYMAGQSVGMDDAMIMEMANIFGWDVDFALDIRKGDHFSVLYEEKFLDGEKIGNGAILAAEFTNQGHKFRAVRYTHADGDSHYYTPEGESMRKAFLLAPVDFRRISGNFNPKRLHPIFKTVRPHRGTDYAADTGTPVWASGDGKVIASGYTKPNGNYVFIQHGNNIVTKYLHLHKRHVKNGQRVKQKQVIGTVGATGYATGPHLHYEFLLDGVHRNPRTIVQKLPKAKSVAGAEKQDFLAQTQPLMAQLQQHTSASQLAMGDTERKIN
ncbi:peptidoglycan DD-metalloendopeptidase family protein [Gilvimarinus sp. DA14]|uniref:peptidoglycan DD-metalloendopeptidase family protein n=1 Tax=Gilvimarinus sp. DA14 TaxID=2956798 RepID=UPI0020B71140|nr:peptidoglycan DD-metalloendopeptidase family protein [Gilvimarinus sp. DA14]UTF59401.1 peptidoglycan DD-metalloendopeptidase family protein [Gilvimarinus sp. DA14]